MQRLKKIIYIIIVLIVIVIGSLVLIFKFNTSDDSDIKSPHKTSKSEDDSMRDISNKAYDDMRSGE